METVCNSKVKKEVSAFIGCFLVGIIFHIPALTSIIQFHDDINEAFDVGSTFVLGRWSNDIIYNSVKNLFGSVISTSAFNGVMSLAILSMIGIMLCRTFSIKNLIGLIAVGVMLVTFPSIIMLFGYKFMCYVWALAFFFATCAIGLVEEKCDDWIGKITLNCFLILVIPGLFSSVPNALLSGAIVVLLFGLFIAYLKLKNKTIRIIWSVLLITFSIGIYQAVIPFILTIILLYELLLLIDDNHEVKDFFYDTGLWIHILICSVGLYYAINKGYTHAFDITPASYQGFDNFGKVPLVEYLKRLVFPYREMLVTRNSSESNMFPGNLSVGYYASIVLSITLLIKLMAIEKQKAGRKLLTILWFALFPLAINFIYIMCGKDNTSFHALMLYSQVFVYIVPIVLLSIATKKGLTEWILFKTERIVLIAVLVLSFQFSSACYTKGIVLQERAINYFSVLQSRIQSVEGYREGMSIAFVNADNKSTMDIDITDEYNDIKINPYNVDSLINDYVWEKYMAYWVGYKPNLKSASTVDQSIIDSMTSYPDDGSIILLDDLVVVKF